MVQAYTVGLRGAAEWRLNGNEIGAPEKYGGSSTERWYRRRSLLRDVMIACGGLRLETMVSNHKAGFAKARKRVQSLTDGVRDVAEYAASRLIFYTPVITGYLRGGWSVGLNVLPDETGRFDKIGEQTLTKIKGTLATFKLGQTINIADRVFYGPFVDRGTTRIAPRNITKRAEADLKLRMKEIIIRRWRSQ